MSLLFIERFSLFTLGGHNF